MLLPEVICYQIKKPNVRHGTPLLDMWISHIPETLIQYRLFSLLLVVHTNLMVRPVTEDTT